MNVKRLMLLVGVGASLSAMAAPLTPQQALERMASGKPSRMAATNPASLKLAYTSNTEQGVASAYVFNRDNGGYMILAADDVAYPVLGYSDNGVIDPNNMSPELKWWLDCYADQIQHAIANNATAALKAPQSRAGQEAIAPLLTTKWDQGAPYYNDCPKIGGRNTYTGCVATSMAQVMNYHKYPEKGQGALGYTPNSTIGRIYLNFAKQEFDWANMLDYYNSGSYNDEQAAAVAYLMKACGYSVQMGYGLEASGASGTTIGKALVTYFNYDKNTRTLRREVYSATDWEQMVYDNLKNVGPLIINGASPMDGGHSFVCDGYDGNGYYHINWGWSGVSDGYYALGALNPETQGIGGYDGGFNFTQNGVFGIQPPTDEPALPKDLSVYQYGSSVGSMNGKILTITTSYTNHGGWCASGDTEHENTFALSITPVNGGDATMVSGTFQNREKASFPCDGSYFSASNGRGFSYDLANVNLADGKYKAQPLTKAEDVEGAEWVPITVDWASHNYVILNVSGSNITVENIAPYQFNISDLQFKTTLYYNKFALMSLHVENNHDIEVTQGACPELYDATGKKVFTGESILLSLKANESIDYEWPVRFVALTGAPSVTQPTEFTLKLYNPHTNTYYEGIDQKVTMDKNPGNVNVVIENAAIEGAQKGTFEYAGQEFNGVYYVGNTSDMNFSFDANVRSGYLDSEIRVSLSQADAQNPSMLNPIVDELAAFMPFMSAGSTQTFTVPIQFANAVPEMLYYISIVYNGRIIGRTPFTLNNTGVNDVMIDANLPVEYYTLQGVRITNPAKGELVIVRQGSKVFKTIIK